MNGGAISQCRAALFEEHLKFNSRVTSRPPNPPIDCATSWSVCAESIPFEAIHRRDLQPQPVRIAKFNHRT